MEVMPVGQTMFGLDLSSVDVVGCLVKYRRRCVALLHGLAYDTPPVRSPAYTHLCAHPSPYPLQTNVIASVDLLMSQDFSWIFGSPVDPVKLGLADYFDVVKRVRRTYTYNYFAVRNDIRLLSRYAIVCLLESSL